MPRERKREREKEADDGVDAETSLSLSLSLHFYLSSPPLHFFLALTCGLYSLFENACELQRVVLHLEESLHIFRLLCYREPTLRRVCWAAVTNCAPVTSLMTQTRFAVGFTRWHSADRKLQVANRFKPQVDIQFVTDQGLIIVNIRPGRGRGLISGG